MASPTGESSNPPGAKIAPPEIDIESLFKMLEDWNEQLKPLKDKDNSRVGGGKATPLRERLRPSSAFRRIPRERQR